MASHPTLKPSPLNPLLTDPLANPCGLADALCNSSDVLRTLADLFGHDEHKGGYSVLDSKESRYGLWLQLNGVADLLKAASEIATVEPACRVGGEVTIPFSESDWERLQALARQRATSVEGLIEGMIARDTAHHAPTSSHE